MVTLLALLAAAQPPVPPVRPPPRNHDVELRCDLFARDGARGSLTGRLEHVNRYRRLITMASSSDLFPVDPPRTPSSNDGPNEEHHKVVRGTTEYNYVFSFPSMADANGTVTVAVREGRSAFSYVATGICDVARTEVQTR